MSDAGDLSIARRDPLSDERGNVGPAEASTKRVTQLAGTKKTLEAQTDCGQGTAVSTKIAALECI